jgi:hypothetical protein
MQMLDFKRRVVVDDEEYFIEVKRSETRHVERFATRCYAVIERPNHWLATVPVPDCVRVTTHLWYRELIELVQHARRVVSRRTAVVA